MPVVNFVTYDGVNTEVTVESGTNLMQAALNNGIDSIIAECGGACSCATCHCYIDDAWFDKVGQAEEMEQEMISYALNPEANSRLSCQVVVTEDMDGLIIKLPENQY
ncbi:MAG: 2Fe-2S iron-sulfur cluster-binding protein [Spongiibacteraceae bacterium]